MLYLAAKYCAFDNRVSATPKLAVWGSALCQEYCPIIILNARTNVSMQDMWIDTVANQSHKPSVVGKNGESASKIGFQLVAFIGVLAKVHKVARCDVSKSLPR